MKDRVECRVSADQGSSASLIGESGQMVEIRRMIEELAPTRISVLITGECGVGKELVARALHDSSPRGGSAYVAVNCPGLADNLVESELFGHAKGAFTSAISDKMGLIETANGGTLFLDEIGDMALSAQAKVLRVLETKEVTRIGENRTRRVDFRVVSATNRDLEDASRSGSFRLDLLFRLKQEIIQVPPLRDHKDDIPCLVAHFHREFLQEAGWNRRPDLPISSQALNSLMGYDFPGNIRELRSLIHVATNRAKGETIRLEHLGNNVTDGSKPVPERDGDRVDRDALLAALKGLTLPGRDGTVREWCGSVRAVDAAEIFSFLVHTQGEEFTRRELANFLSKHGRDDMDKYASTGRYIQFLRKGKVLEYNGGKGNKTRFRLSDTFVTGG